MLFASSKSLCKLCNAFKLRLSLITGTSTSLTKSLNFNTFFKSKNIELKQEITIKKKRNI